MNGQQAIAALAEHHAVFRLKRPVPLAIGIRTELIAHGHDPALIDAALAHYTSTAEYHAAVVHMGSRYNSHGEKVGKVSPDSVAYSIKRLDQIKAEKETAQRDAFRRLADG